MNGFITTMPATPLTGQDIIDRFERYTGDTTELSTAEELSLANKVLREIFGDRDWNFLKKNATGTLSGSTITPPLDFDHFAINNLETDISVGSGNASPKVIFLGVTTGVYAPFQIVNFSDRRQYANRSGYCWYDMVNRQIKFSTAPVLSDMSYEFDYIYSPGDITLATSPVLPSQFHEIVQHGMAVDDMIIQLFDRSKSYAKENEAKFDSWMSQLRFWNSQFEMQ